jgi:hypothetical protein
MTMERLIVVANDVQIMYNVQTRKFEATITIHNTDTETHDIIYLVEKE